MHRLLFTGTRKGDFNCHPKLHENPRFLLTFFFFGWGVHVRVKPAIHNSYVQGHRKRQCLCLRDATQKF